MGQASCGNSRRPDPTDGRPRIRAARGLHQPAGRRPFWAGEILNSGAAGLNPDRKMKPKVLYILHNHPTVRPGGAEAYAVELYEAMRGSEQFDPMMVARVGRSGSVETAEHPGAPFSLIGSDPAQYYL